MALPPGLDIGAIRRAVKHIERESVDLVELCFDGVRGFGPVVGAVGALALDRAGAYEKHRHADTAQQRFPDLRKRGSGPTPKPEHCLESKGSKRPWAIQSHYDHPGWYIVWRYLVDPTQSLERGKPVVIWRVDVLFLKKADWKYEKSKAGKKGGGRTHTFGVRRAAKTLKGKSVYRRRDVVVRDGKPMPRNGDDGR